MGQPAAGAATHAVTRWLAVAPALTQPADASLDAETRCLGAEDMPHESLALGRVARAIEADGRPLLALAPALPLAAALLLLRERLGLREAFQRLDRAGCDVASLAPSLVAALLALELEARGEPSDLTALPGAPSAWTYLAWRTSADGLSVVARGRHIRARRLRPEPRMACASAALERARAASRCLVCRLARARARAAPNARLRTDAGF
jgi:hypothetical protein